MALSAEKRQEMADTLGVSVEALQKVEQENANTGEKAVESGAEFKEKTDQPEGGEQEVVTEKDEVVDEAPEYVSLKDFNQFGEELTRGFTDAMHVMTTAVKELQAQVADMQQQKVEEEKALTPGASIYANMMKAVGGDLNESKAKELEATKPVETQPEQPVTRNGIAVPFIGQMHQMNANHGVKS